MKLENMRIGARLGAGFGIVLLLLAAAIGLGLRNMDTIEEALLDVTQKHNVKLAAAESMSKAQMSAILATANVVLLTDEGEMAAEDRKVLAARADYDAASKSLHEMVVLPEGLAILARIDAAAAATRPLTDKTRRLGLQNRLPEATAALVKEVGPASARWQSAIREMIVHQEANTKRADEVAAEAYASARFALATLGALAVALGGLVAWLATRSITGPLRMAVGVAQRVAAGDLRSEIHTSAKDETGDLLRALAAMSASLRDIVGKVRAGTETIATASTQIASGNLDLSSRTEQQAGSLEETASSMEELAATVKNNADNARQADALAASASEVAVKGGAVVAQVVDTMASIHVSSSKIVDIIAVIDGIAFQTNILALNAAVEAARAGEQGRGFAVVASEVRNLAQRSAGAAKEIKLLIDDSVAKVAQGSALVGSAGTTMEEVVASVRRVTDIMGEISAAGKEQELGIGQVNQAIIEMDGATQQNAALVEQAAAAAQSLQDQAAELSAIVGVFQLAEQGHIEKASQVRAPARAAPVPKARTIRPALAKPKLPLTSVAASKDLSAEHWEEF